jgi:hypothetical protein
MRHTGALAAVAATGLAAVCLSACSAGKTASAGTSASPAMETVADVMAAATKKSAAVKSFKISMTEQVPGLGTITSSGVLSRNPVAADLTASNPQLTQSLGVSSLRILMTGSVIYEDLGDKFAASDGGKPWMKLDLAELGASGKALADAANQNTGQSPDASLALLTSSGAVKRVGTETVDGVTATHYAGTLTAQQIVSLGQSKTTQQDLQKMVDQAKTLGMTGETVDLWLDANDLPVEAHETAQTSKGPLDITIHYSGLSDSPVQVTVPPADQTADFAQMLQQLKALQQKG